MVINSNFKTHNKYVVLETDGNAYTFLETLLNIGNKTQQKNNSTIAIWYAYFSTSVSGVVSGFQKSTRKYRKFQTKLANGLKERVILASKNDVVCKINE